MPAYNKLACIVKDIADVTGGSQWKIGSFTVSRELLTNNGVPARLTEIVGMF